MGFNEKLGGTGVLDLGAQPGPPTANSNASAGARTLVDAKVGEINGHPIYATEFLEPMSARLREESVGKPLQAWRAAAEGTIRKELNSRITDTLLREEGRATLTEQTRQGLLNFLERVREEIASEASGSVVAGEERIRERTGVSAEEYLRQREDEVLVREAVQRISARVQVSSAEVEREYIRRNAEYNPPPRARFLLITAPKAKPEDIEAISAALAGGAKFAATAQDPRNTYPRTVREVDLKDTLAESPIFPSLPAVDAAARQLQVGAHAGPVDFDAQDVAWVYLESIEDRRVSFYQAQLAIRERLVAERFNEEAMRVVGMLRARANRIDEEAVVSELLRIAEDRYYRPGASAASEGR